RSLNGIVNCVQGSVRSTAVISTVLLGTAGTLQADTAAWRGKTLAVAGYPPSRLNVTGLSDDFILGATPGVYEPQNTMGAKLQADYAIEDPTLRVARKLFLAAQQQYEVVAAPDVAAPRLANPKELTNAAQGGADLLLDVAASNSVAKGFNGRYWVGTSMDGRIIDLRAGKVVSSSFCTITRGGDPEALTHDELIADNAARLKGILARQADACLEKFKVKVLSIH